MIIEILRGNRRTTAWFQKQRSARIALRYSPVTRAEVRAGTRPKERAAISALFESITVVPIDASTADLAGEQLARYSRTHNVQLGDALIAAGALEHGDELATFNARHFPGIKKIVTPDR
ncbi:MAG: type II toxin-antitoxin system VapC family toxin [Candidatus Dormibacteraeota bacterium]|nr:type II toxin-antitoxin system VapC family toxin [Candidatus Dormibacteraeota bacterium]